MSYEARRRGIACGWGCLGLLAALATVTVLLILSELDQSRTVACLSNVNELMIGLRMYAEDYDHRLPDASRWMDLGPGYVRDRTVYRCPAVDAGAGCGYAFNSGLSMAHLRSPELECRVVMVYDSTNLKRNAADAVSSIPATPRHMNRNTIGYADGHAESVRPGRRP